MNTNEKAEVLVQVNDLKVHFPIYKKGLLLHQIGSVKAVNGVSFQIRKGETFGLVGESGCGKTTTGKALLHLYPNYTTGDVIFDGKNITQYNEKRMRIIRREMQLIFQDPFSSLDSRMTVGKLLEEPFIIHKILSKKERKTKVESLLEDVGLPKETITRYPGEFSGGQRQRIGIARAIALNPKFIVCDEPVSALDVSVQSQILNLMCDLKEKYNLTQLFIAHGLNVVKHVSDRIGIMYLGKIVEIAEKADIYKNPLHPYTEALISAIPVPDPTVKNDRILMQGDVPSPINPPKGCPFHTRCRYASDFGGICMNTLPEMKEIESNHYVRCHRY